MATVAERIRDSVAKIVDGGAHLDLAEATQKIARELGLSERLVHYTHTELRNRLDEPRFKKVPPQERILFLPQCLRNSKECKAELTDEGWKCRKCGKCKIKELVELAEKKGYKKIFIVPGGSMIVKLAQKYKPKAIVGIACHEEVNLGIEKAHELNMPAIGILLLREGCKDTDVSIDEVKEKLLLDGSNE